MSDRMASIQRALDALATEDKHWLRLNGEMLDVFRRLERIDGLIARVSGAVSEQARATKTAMAEQSATVSSMADRIDAKIASCDKAIGTTNKRIDDLPQPPELPPPVDLSPLRSEIDGLRSDLKALAARPQPVAQMQPPPKPVRLRVTQRGMNDEIVAVEVDY